MNLAKLLESAIAEGGTILAKPAKAATVKVDGPPRPSTWEYLIDALSLVPQGTFIPLKHIIPIMRERGWTTKAGTDELAYRTVHSSTYKACRDKRAGYVLGAEVIDRSHARDTLYAIIPGSTFTKTIRQHQEWVASFIPAEPEQVPAQDTEEAPAQDTEHSPEQVAEKVEQAAPKVSTRRRRTRKAS